MTTLREAAQAVVDTKDWQGLYFALADLRAALATPEPVGEDDKDAVNARVSLRYDVLRAQGKHGHYESMFRVVHEECAALLAERDRLQAVIDAARAPMFSTSIEAWEYWTSLVKPAQSKGEGK